MFFVWRSTISCFCVSASLTHTYFLLFLSSCLFPPRNTDQGHIIEAEDGYILCLFLLLSRYVSQSRCWGARSHFHHAPNSLEYFLLCSSSCLFRRPSLGHSNISRVLEGGTSTHWILFFVLGLNTQDEPVICFLGDSICVAHLFFC